MSDIEGPFTPDSLYKLLIEKILKRYDGIFSTCSPQVIELTSMLNVQREVILASRSPQPTGIAPALRVLDEQLPMVGRALENAKQLFERVGASEKSKRKLERNIMAYESLLDSIDSFRDENLHIAIDFQKKRNEWMDWCERFEWMFKKTFPTAPQEATYRFISEVTPLVTGEPIPGDAAVKTEMMRQRRNQLEQSA